VKVLYASTVYPPAVGGAQLHLHRLAQAVQAAGHEVKVVTHTSRYRRDWLRMATVGSERPARYWYGGVAVDRVGFSLRTRLAMLPWALAYYPAIGSSARRLARKVEPYVEGLVADASVVHATRIGREFLPRALLDLARRRGIPFVLTPNHHPRWKGPLYREYDRLYREADALVALTPYERRMLVEEKGVRAERVHVTGVGPILAAEHSAEGFRERHRLPDRFVLFLGQQLPYKGIAALLAATELVWKDHPDVRFVFVGPRTDWSRRLFARVHDPRVLNLGQVDLEAKTSALAACELLCVPSAQESFGGVFVEAWTMGKPVVGGRIPPVASLVDEGVDGLLAPQEPRALARALGALLDDPARAAAMGAAGREKARRYAWEALSARTVGIYEGLVARNARNPSDQ
jgi:glycosyltransferase involved in cell wall biosynthesis